MGLDPGQIAQDGRYHPFTRPLFIYVSLQALEDQEGLEEFVEHYLDTVHDILPRVYFYRADRDV